MHLFTILVLAAVPAFSIIPPIQLRNVPLFPGKDASKVLDRRLASFSFELAYFPVFAGNRTNPNILTQNLIQRLVERTGVGPDIRPGGITVDSSIFDPTIDEGLILDLSDTGGIFRSTYGPAFFESHAMFPNTTRFVVDVNLGNNSIDIAHDQIKASIAHLGWNRIYSLQLGNEPDHFAGGSRPVGWSIADYTAQFLNWTSSLSTSLKLPPHIFQAGTFVDDPIPGAAMTTVDALKDGIDTTGVVKLFDQHTYQYSTCDPARNARATLSALVNHRNITAYLDLWKPQIAAAQARGKEFVVGEYGSVSCSGKENVTDTFGQAIWLADTVLYGASINISRMFLHQGATLVFQSSSQANTVGFSWYDLWYPVPSERFGTARASPSFVAYLLVGEAVGSSAHSRIQLINVPEAEWLAAYAIWDPVVKPAGVARLVLINTAIRNQTTASVDDGSVIVDITPLMMGSKSQVRVKRMSSPGADSKISDESTWAGQAYTNGTASGKEIIEHLNHGKITVRGSEAVLVVF